MKGANWGVLHLTQMVLDRPALMPDWLSVS